MKKINLHSHSFYSDGYDSPERVVELAHNGGFELISLTDHNTFDGYPRFVKECEKYNIDYIKGVEIDCIQPEIDFHQELLAYFPNGGEECLDEVLRCNQQSRLERVERALKRCAKTFSLSNLSMEELSQKAVEEKGFVGFISNKLLYRYLLTKGCKLPQYTELTEFKEWKDIWKREEGDQKYSLFQLLPLVNNGGGFAVLAHFGFHFGANVELMKTKSEEYVELFKEMKKMGLWGVEQHPYRYKEQRDKVNAITSSWAAEAGLHLTTGSDYHGGETSSHKIYDWCVDVFEGFSK